MVLIVAIHVAFPELDFCRKCNLLSLSLFASIRQLENTRCSRSVNRAAARTALAFGEGGNWPKEVI